MRDPAKAAIAHPIASTLCFMTNIINPGTTRASAMSGLLAVAMVIISVLLVVPWFGFLSYSAFRVALWFLG